MKKILCLLILLTVAAGVNANALNSANIVVPVKDSIRKKIVHPTTAMTDAQANDILNTMRQKRNDEEKIDVLKQGVKDKGITVDQLIKLLNQFLTDESKLTGAEYAFPYTTNYKAFLRIMDLFSEQDYKYRLEDFYDKNRK